jgi:hypothetical protein
VFFVRVELPRLAPSEETVAAVQTRRGLAHLYIDVESPLFAALQLPQIRSPEDR